MNQVGAEMRTKDRILSVATRHFAERGFEGASVREILVEAEANSGAAHYHFGSKEDLYHEVLMQFFRDLHARRLAGLEAASHGKGTQAQRIEALVRAYIEPHIELMGRQDGQAFLHLSARLPLEPASVTKPILAELEPIRRKFIEAFVAVMPTVPRARMVLGFNLMVDLMVLAPENVRYLPAADAGEGADDPASLLELVIRFALGGFQSLAMAPQQQRPRAASKTSRRRS